MRRPAIVALTMAIALPLAAGCGVQAPQRSETIDDRSGRARSTADEDAASATGTIVNETANAVGNVVTLPVRALGRLIGGVF
jgi:hypothetical protein